MSHSPLERSVTQLVTIEDIFTKLTRGLPLIGGGGGWGVGVQALVDFYCVLHEEKMWGGGGVQIACKYVYVINGRLLGSLPIHDIVIYLWMVCIWLSVTCILGSGTPSLLCLALTSAIL